MEWQNVFRQKHKGHGIRFDVGGEIKMAYKISDACIKCGACAANCPMSCIEEGEDRYVIDPEKCIECGACAGTCPVSAPNKE